MTTRKTYSLPDDLAAQVEREARRTGRPESAVVRDALERYCADRSEGKLPRFVGMGSWGGLNHDRPLREQIRDAMAEDLARRLSGREEEAE